MPTVPWPVKKFPAFYGRKWFITVFTSAHHLTLPSARSIHSTTSFYFKNIHPNILLPSTPRSSKWFFPSPFPPQHVREKNTRTYIQYFLTLVLFTFCTCCILRYVVCIVASCLVCIVVVVLCVLLSSYVYLLYYVCIAIFTLDARLLVRSQYSEGPVTGHLDTGFSWFPRVYKQTLRWFPRSQVANTCFSCSPPDLNLLVTNFIFCIHVK